MARDSLSLAAAGHNRNRVVSPSPMQEMSNTLSMPRDLGQSNSIPCHRVPAIRSAQRARRKRGRLIVEFRGPQVVCLWMVEAIDTVALLVLLAIFANRYVQHDMAFDHCWFKDGLQPCAAPHSAPWPKRRFEL